jgi:hypothetical protein
MCGSDLELRSEHKVRNEFSVRPLVGWLAGRARSKGAALGRLAVMVTLHRDRGIYIYIYIYICCVLLARWGFGPGGDSGACGLGAWGLGLGLITSHLHN